MSGCCASRPATFPTRVAAGAGKAGKGGNGSSRSSPCSFHDGHVTRRKTGRKDVCGISRPIKATTKWREKCSAAERGIGRRHASTPPGWGRRCRNSVRHCLGFGPAGVRWAARLIEFVAQHTPPRKDSSRNHAGRGGLESRGWGGSGLLRSAGTLPCATTSAARPTPTPTGPLRAHPSWVDIVGVTGGGRGWGASRSEPPAGTRGEPQNLGTPVGRALTRSEAWKRHCTAGGKDSRQLRGPPGAIGGGRLISLQVEEGEGVI